MTDRKTGRKGNKLTEMGAVERFVTGGRNPHARPLHRKAVMLTLR